MHSKVFVVFSYSVRHRKIAAEFSLQQLVLFAAGRSRLFASLAPTWLPPEYIISSYQFKLQNIIEFAGENGQIKWQNGLANPRGVGSAIFWCGQGGCQCIFRFLVANPVRLRVEHICRPMLLFLPSRSPQCSRWTKRPTQPSRVWKRTSKQAF